MKRAIVTGGAGFIGSHLAKELVRRGYQVVVLDDLSTGKMENIEGLSGQLFSQAEVNFVQGSVTDLPLLSDLLQNIDYVFHLAATPGVRTSIGNPLVSHEVNVTGALNMLLAARENKIKKVIYASSSSVYGDTPILPKREDMLPSPQSPYAVTKLAGEYYCRVFHQVYGLPTACLRYFNVYGPRQDSSSEYAAVIPKFISRLLESKPPIIFGDGKQTRDFTFVKDVVNATVLAAESNATGALNVGTGKRISINELAKLITRLAGKDIRPVHQLPRPGDVRHSLADISRGKEFGYNPRYHLEQGLEETIKEFAR